MVGRGPTSSMKKPFGTQTLSCQSSLVESSLLIDSMTPCAPIRLWNRGYFTSDCVMSALLLFSLAHGIHASYARMLSHQPSDVF